MITPLLRLEVVGDLLILVWFAGFVAAGVYFRRRPDVHKRLMVASCFTIYGPVIARLELVYGLPVPPPAVIPLGLLTLATYDVVVVRRLQRATVWIALLWVGGLLPLLGLAHRHWCGGHDYQRFAISPHRLDRGGQQAQARGCRSPPAATLARRTSYAVAPIGACWGGTSGAEAISASSPAP